jgi:N,N'-diacetyllegionaminate synthase
MTKPTIIIAEIGENHGGDMEMARRMVLEAARAGADIVKFQSYRGTDVRPDDPERDWFGKVELDDAMHHELKALAEGEGVEFLSAPFSMERARFLCEDLGLRKVKVASSEMLNLPLLDYLNGCVDSVFLSTGMATIDEVRESVDHLGNVDSLYIMHCTTQYPCSDENANLRAIGTLRQEFPEHSIGYSDHTLGAIAPLAAVALGATAIEKHFTLDKSLPGTDHVLSVTPEELKELVDSIRKLEAMLGSAVKAPVAEEQEIMEFVRSRWAKG